MDYRKLIDDKYHTLVTHVHPSNEFLCHLRSSAYIRPKINVIKQLQLDADKTEELLNFLQDAPDEFLESAVECFIAALKATEQDHVANVFTRVSDSMLMADEHREAFRNNLAELCQFIEPRDGLVDVLVQDHVLTSADSGAVLSKLTVDDMAKEILSILIRKSNCSFDKFLHALISQDQCHVVFILTGRQEGHNSIPMSKEHRNILTSKMDQLCANLDPENGVLVLLLSANVFNRAGYDRLSRQPQGYSMVRELISSLVRRPDSAFDVFLDILKKSKQDHVVYILTNDGNVHPLLDSCRAALAKKRDYLVENMEPINLGLLTILYSSGVLTMYDEDRLTDPSAGTPSDKINLLIRILSRKSQEDYESFIKALQDTNQSHIAETLKGVQITGHVNVHMHNNSDASDQSKENELRKGMTDALINNNYDVKKLTDELSANGTAIADVKNGSILISFRCDDAESVENLEKLYNARTLDVLFTEAFCGKSWSKDVVSLSLSISNDEFLRAQEQLKLICPITVGNREALRLALESAAITDELLKSLSLSKRAVRAINASEVARDTLFGLLRRRPDVEVQGFLDVLKTFPLGSVVQTLPSGHHTDETCDLVYWKSKCRKLEEQCKRLQRMHG